MPDSTDPTWLEISPLIAFAVVAVVAIVVSAVVQTRRRRGLEEAAMRLGLLFQRKAEMGEEPFFQFPLFKRGSRQRLRNLMQNGDTFVFDFRYVLGSGKKSRTVRQTVAVHRVGGEPLPAFRLEPEGLANRVNEWLGAVDVDFDEDPRFSKRYQLSTEQEDPVRELFHADLRTRLCEEARPWHVEGAGSFVAFFRKGKTISPNDLTDFVHETRQLAQTFAR